MEQKGRNICCFDQHWGEAQWGWALAAARNGHGLPSGQEQLQGGYVTGSRRLLHWALMFEVQSVWRASLYLFHLMHQDFMGAAAGAV